MSDFRATKIGIDRENVKPIRKYRFIFLILYYKKKQQQNFNGKSKTKKKNRRRFNKRREIIQLFIYFLLQQ